MTVKTKKRKINKKTKNQLISIVLIGLSIFALYTIVKQLRNVYELKQRSAIVEKELTELQDENASLLSTKSKLEDPNYVTTYARGEYMFSKGDEKVFYLPSNSEETSEEATEVDETPSENSEENEASQ